MQTKFIPRNDHESLLTDFKFRKIGFAFSEINNLENEKKYFLESKSHMQHLRKIANPYPYPSDTMRIFLDEIWPNGANILRHNNKLFFSGIARYQLCDVDLEPHTDNIVRNLPKEISINIIKQLSVNVYLQMPKSGGILQIWDLYPTEKQYHLQSGNRKYGISRSLINTKPILEINPQAGDAIFIDSRRLHAVTPTADIPRITIGLFIAYLGDNQPLKVWS